MTLSDWADLLMTNEHVACDYLRDQGYDELADRILSSREARVYWANYARAGTRFCDYRGARELAAWADENDIGFDLDPWYQMAEFVGSHRLFGR